MFGLIARKERLLLSALAERSSDEDQNLFYGQFLDDFSRTGNKDASINDETR